MTVTSDDEDDMFQDNNEDDSSTAAKIQPPTLVNMSHKKNWGWLELNINGICQFRNLPNLILNHKHSSIDSCSTKFFIALK